MKINKYIALTIFLGIVLALAVASQLAITPIQNPDVYVDSKVTSINPKLSVEAKSDCVRTYFNQTEIVYAYIQRMRDTYGTCFNPTNQSNYACVNGTETYQSYEPIGTQIVLENTSTCTPRSFVVSMADKGKKEVDYSSWGVCVQSVENDCVAVYCGTLEGGSAWNGVFNGCDGGKSCEKFLFCKDGYKVLYKASREDFVEWDPTFKLNKLDLMGVGK